MREKEMLSERQREQAWCQEESVIQDEVGGVAVVLCF